MNDIHTDRYIVRDGIFIDHTSGKNPTPKRPGVPSTEEGLDEMLVHMRQLAHGVPKDGDLGADLAERFIALDDWLSSAGRELPRCWSGSHPHRDAEVAGAADAGIEG